LIDVEEGLAGFVFPIGPNGESSNMRLSGSCGLRRPSDEREEMKLGGNGTRGARGIESEPIEKRCQQH